MSAVYKGALRYKRKTELLEMAEKLNFSIDDSLKREELEYLIRDYLVSNRSRLEASPTWEGIYASMDNVEKRAGRSSTVLSNESDGSDDAPVKSPRKHTQRKTATGLGTPLRQVSGAAQDAAQETAQRASSFANSLVNRTQRSFENLADVFRAKAEDVRTDAEEAATEVQREVQREAGALRRRASQTLRASKRKAHKGFEEARDVASNAKNITVALLALEAVLLVLSVTPTVYLEFGNRSAAGLLKAGAGKAIASGKVPHWAVTVPDVRGLISLAFWLPLALWSFYTVAIPTLFAHLITFDRRHEPSVLSFNLVRLFSILLLANVASSSVLNSTPQVLGVAAGQTAVRAGILGSFDAFAGYSWVSQHVGTNFQLLATGLATAFATYETIAVRPRAS